MFVDSEVVVIGAGPYGLAAAAHLNAIGTEYRMFGRPMDFWSERMPKGMLLRSSWRASHISDPGGGLTLDVYQRTVGRRISQPLPVENFIDYGLWFQREVSPGVDTRRVLRVEAADKAFRVVLEDGDRVLARRVVVATGIGYFAYCPEILRGFPPALVSHASDHRDLSIFARKRVLVVGSGQSAIESAALLAERGAEVEVLVRAREVRWLRKHTSGLARNRFVNDLLYPPTDVGPPFLNRIVAAPTVFKLMPVQNAIAYRCIRPAAAIWLKPRVTNVRVTTRVNITSVRPRTSDVLVSLSDGSRRSADHILAATGYRIDIAQYRFLSPLMDRIRRTGGYPLLHGGYESSVEGLHFLGAPAAASYGPVMRFVSGTTYAASRLAAALRGKAIGCGRRVEDSVGAAS